MRDVVKQICDDDEFMEVMPYFAANLVIGYCRLEGRTVGIIANQPHVLGEHLIVMLLIGVVRTCDCYGIPLLVFVDVPGFYLGAKEEKKGILRHGCKMLYAFSEATVPKVTVIM